MYVLPAPLLPFHTCPLSYLVPIARAFVTSLSNLKLHVLKIQNLNDQNTSQISSVIAQLMQTLLHVKCDSEVMISNI